MNIGILTLITSLLVFCTYFAYIVGYKSGFNKGSREVLEAWRQWIRDFFRGDNYYD